MRSKGFRTVPGRDKPEDVLIDLLFHYTVLMEYSLLDLQSSVRHFVERMSDAVAQLDRACVAQAAQAREAAALAAARVPGNAHRTEHGTEHRAGSGEVAKAKVENAILTALQDAARLDERLSEHVYTLVECLSFEDIQAQRIEHLTRAFRKLNEGIMERLERGLENYTSHDIERFADESARETRSTYTMPEERNIFDQVFYGKFAKPA